MQNNRYSQLLFVVFLIFSQCTCTCKFKKTIFIFFFFICYKRVYPRFTADCPFNRGCQAFPRSLLSIFTVVTACCLFIFTQARLSLQPVASNNNADCPLYLYSGALLQTVPLKEDARPSCDLFCPFLLPSQPAAWLWPKAIYNLACTLPEKI